MSAEQKRCFSNWSKGETNIFQLRTTIWFRGFVSSNQIHLSKFLFNLLKITNLKVWFPGVLEELWSSLQEAAGIYFFRSDQFRSHPSCTKPYRTEPRYFKPIFRPFWPIFWAKVPKSKWIWFEDTYPLNQWVFLSWKMFVSPFDQFEKHHFGSADMCWASLNKHILQSLPSNF